MYIGSKDFQEVYKTLPATVSSIISTLIALDIAVNAVVKNNKPKWSFYLQKGEGDNLKLLLAGINETKFNFQIVNISINGYSCSQAEGIKVLNAESGCNYYYEVNPISESKYINTIFTTMNLKYKMEGECKIRTAIILIRNKKKRS